MSAPYELIPVGAHGLEESRVRLVRGPSLRDSLTRAELSRRLVTAALENERLRSELDEARREAAGAQRLSQRLDNESALRVKAQSRLNKVALALAVIEGLHPEAADAVGAAREEIWGLGDA